MISYIYIMCTYTCLYICNSRKLHEIDSNWSVRQPTSSDGRGWEPFVLKRAAGPPASASTVGSAVLWNPSILTASCYHRAFSQPEMSDHRLFYHELERRLPTDLTVLCQELLATCSMFLHAGAESLSHKAQGHAPTWPHQSSPLCFCMASLQGHIQMTP